MLEELKSCFMEAYDDNQDGKIDIREVCAGLSACQLYRLVANLQQFSILPHMSYAQFVPLSIYPFTHLPFAVRDILAEIRCQIAF